MTLGPLSSHLKQFDYENNLEELSKLVGTCDPDVCSDVSFWGQRVVTVPNYSGSVSLEWLTQQVQRALYKKREKDNLTLADRIAGLDIVKKLQEFYVTTDKKLSSKFFLTRVFNWIREFSVLPYNTRFYLEQVDAREFTVYSKDKFKKAFGVDQDLEELTGDPLCEYSSHNYFYIREDVLRERAAQGFTE